MIEVRHLTKRYGDTLAVDDLNFTIEKGRIYGFLGPNGAGKSTTMNIITGYLASTDGSVTINGYDILEDTEAAKKNIGYLPELPPLYFDMTVKEYLAFDKILCCGGSWMVKGEFVKSGDFEKIRELTREAKELAGVSI